MKSVRAEELLSAIEAGLSLLTASPEEQEAWARREDFPAEEIALQYYDSVPGYFDRLRHEGLIEPEDEEALLAVKRCLEANQALLFRDGPYVAQVGQWREVRKLALKALSRLASRRPPPGNRANHAS